MRAAGIISVAVLLFLVLAGLYWASSKDYGLRQAVEFMPYDEVVTLDDGSRIFSSGVVIRLNERGAAPTDREMASLMLSAMEMYPYECSGDNWEVAVRRPVGDGSEEKYSYYYSVYDMTYSDISSPVSMIEYGRWEGQQYVVINSYDARWDEIAGIADGREHFIVNAEIDSDSNIE